MWNKTDLPTTCERCIVFEKCIPIPGKCTSSFYTFEIPSNQGKDLEENYRYNFENRLPGNLTWLAIKWMVKFTIVLIENHEGLFVCIGPTSIVRMQCTCTQNRGYYFYSTCICCRNVNKQSFPISRKRASEKMAFYSISVWVWISLKQNDCQHFLYNTPSMYRHVRIIGYVHYCRVTALGGVMYPRQINPSADGGKINPSECYPSSW